MRSEGEIAMSVYDTFGAGLSAGLFALVGVIATSGTSDFHKNASQLEAELQAKAEIALVKFDWASVKVDGQRATVSGAPPNETDAADAEAAVLKASGKGGPIWGGVISVETAYSETQQTADISPYVCRAVKKTDGGLTFVGFAPDAETSNSLASHLNVPEGAAIDNRVEVASGAPEAGWADMARFGMDQLSLLDTGEAKLTDLELRLRGIAMDDAARIQVSAAVSNISEPWTGVAEISGPSHWKAEHVGETLVLSGSCETDADKSEIAAIADQYFEGEVIDQMSVASSEYANWVDGVRLGLPHFSKFESGEMAFEPKDAGFSFEGEATASTLQFLREDMAQLEGNYGVQLGVESVTVELNELQGIDLGSDPLIACQMAFDLVMQANAVVFNTGSAEISRNSGETLDKIMAVSENCSENLRFEVAGHTDNTGAREANTLLSEARAQAVANYMQTAGFNSARLIVSGYGPDQPTADNATPEGRAENRRIEFRIQEWSE
jgi:OOP family OmpA-OmpF porin